MICSRRPTLFSGSANGPSAALHLHSDQHRQATAGTRDTLCCNRQDTELVARRAGRAAGGREAGGADSKVNEASASGSTVAETSR